MKKKKEYKKPVYIRKEANYAKRGDVFYIKEVDKIEGSEQGGCRPGVIIQNNTGNKHSPTVIIAYLTTKSKKSDLPTHSKATIKGVENIVLCEQIRTINKSRLLEKIHKMTPQEMDDLDAKLAISIALNKNRETTDKKENTKMTEELKQREQVAENYVRELSELIAERNRKQELYDMIDKEGTKVSLHIVNNGVEVDLEVDGNNIEMVKYMLKEQADKLSSEIVEKATNGIEHSEIEVREGKDKLVVHEVSKDGKSELELGEGDVGAVELTIENVMLYYHEKDMTLAETAKLMRVNQSKLYKFVTKHGLRKTKKSVGNVENEVEQLPR